MTHFFSSPDGRPREIRFRLDRLIIGGLVILLIVGVVATGREFKKHGSVFLRESSQSIKGGFSRMWQQFKTDSFEKHQANLEQKVTVVQEESQVIEVVQRASPAVVSIIASAEVPKLERCYQRRPGFGFSLPQFDDFFNLQRLCQNGTEKRRVSAGSGFFVSPDGYIVTNKHVVADEKGEYTVVLNDEKHLGKKLNATVLARDPSNDIAILKVDEHDLPFLTFGESDHVQVGQTTIAIGYALGEFDNTVSKGVVSGVSRSIQTGGESAEELRNLIQTDAAINPGNSGGPLLNILGQVIGVNTAVAEAQNIGFAIPGSVARRAFEQTHLSGKIQEEEYAFFGVRYTPVTPELQAEKKLAYDYGMLIGGEASSTNDRAVVAGSPAEKAGIQDGDILLEIDGKQLNERYLLSDAIEIHHPGDVVEVMLLRKGETKKVTVTLGKRGSE